MRSSSLPTLQYNFQYSIIISHVKRKDKVMKNKDTNDVYRYVHAYVNIRNVSKCCNWQLCMLATVCWFEGNLKVWVRCTLVQLTLCKHIPSPNWAKRKLQTAKQLLHSMSMRWTTKEMEIQKQVWKDRIFQELINLYLPKIGKQKLNLQLL